MASCARAAAVQVQTEVPSIFKGAMPPRAAAAMEDVDVADQQRDRQRIGYVPDLLMYLPPEQEESSGAAHTRLLEVKTTLGKARYTQIARDTRAVDGRADKLMGEYRRMLHAKDVEWCGMAADKMGPMESVLRSHGKLHGLVFSAIGEASMGVHKLIRLFAQNMAAKVLGMRDIPRQGAKVIIGRFAWSVRRTVAMSHWRGLAGRIIDRKSIMDNNGEVPHWGQTAGQQARGAAEAGRAHARQRAAARDGPAGFERF
jgi:hypothetical protein